MQAIASDAIPSDAGVRCKRPSGSQRNGRRFQHLEMSDRLRALLVIYQGVFVNESSQ